MKRAKLLSFGLIMSFLAAVGAAGTAAAVWSPNFQSSEAAVTVPKDATHQGSLYAAGNDVVVDGTVTGSVYCAGSNVTITGVVKGDVLCAGQKVTIDGTVDGDVRAAGQFIQVDGTVGGSLTAFAQDVRLSQGATVAGDINGLAQQFTLGGAIGGDVAVGTQLFALDGAVKGNVDVATEQLQVSNRASVLGNFNYGAPKELSFNASVVTGEVSFNPTQTGDHRENGRRLLSGVKVVMMFMLIMSALVMILIAPRFIDRSSEIFRRQVLMTILLGFAFLFGGPILVGILLFSVVLAPLGLALLFGWLAILCLSGIFFAYWVGAELLRTQKNAVIRMLGGLVIVVIAYMIPVLGGITLFASLIIGSGMVVATLTNGYKRPSYRLGAVTKKQTAKKAS